MDNRQTLQQLQQQVLLQLQKNQPAHPNTAPVPAVTNPVSNFQENGDQMVVPTIQQLNYIFKLFQMMQQLGILNTETSTPKNTELNEYHGSLKDDTTITTTLANGDQIVKLENGKYGLIKKKSE